MTTPARAALAATVSEKEWQAQVLDLAGRLGWKSYHTHDSRRSAAGFPDLVLVRDRVVFTELKRVGGRLSPDQSDWIVRLLAAGSEVYIWTPEDWSAVLETLRRRTDQRTGA